MVIAIRGTGRLWARYYGGGPQSAGYVGEISAVERMRRDEFPGNPWTWAPPLFSALMCLIGGIFALGFAWQHRRERGIFLVRRVAPVLKVQASTASPPSQTLRLILLTSGEISRAMAEAGGILASLAFYSVRRVAARTGSSGCRPLRP